MKHKQIIFVFSLITAVFLVSSCEINFDGDYFSNYQDLEGTSWARESGSIMEIITFNDAYRGTDTVFNNGVTQYSFTYTYNSFDETGKITFNDDDSAESFEIQESYGGNKTLKLDTADGYFFFPEVEYRSVW
jgi:hypothetical protein